MKLTDSPSASSPSAEPPRRGKSPLKRAISWVLRIGVTATLFLLLFRPDLLGIHVKFIKPLRLGELWAAIKEVRLSTFALWFGLAMAIKACGVFSSMLRWRLLLLGQGIRMRFWSLVGAFLVGRWIGMFSPGTLGLDGYRLYFVGRHTGKWVDSTAVIAVEKLTGFIALALLVFLTLPLGMMFFTFKLPILVVILAILGSSILISLACLLNPRILQVLIAILPFSRWAKVQSKFDRLAASVTAYSGQRPLLLGALAFGIVVHFATAIMYFCTAMAIRTEGIRIIHILFASPLMITATVIGPSVGGEGIREIVFVMLLGSHVGQAKTFLFSHLGVWTDAWLCLAGGLFWMLRPADYRPRIDLLRFAEQQGRALSLLSPAEVRDYRLGVWRTLVASAMGGLIGGALTGMIEGVYVLAIA
ncbi:MAG: lysylphosphatidylglycerol synthase transmembrane domain-containing protein, partial [Candidatus Sumerlaeota bacterium]|nr:lysylphosphatidylglycerol synthase transmembrane domain-containing protein [Candidatus Sumerlaeota bacterium]